MHRFSLSFASVAPFTIGLGLLFGILSFAQKEPDKTILALVIFGLGTYIALAYKATTAFDDARRSVTISSGLWPFRAVRQISYSDLEKLTLSASTDGDGWFFAVRLHTRLHSKGIRLEVFDASSIEEMEARAQEVARACGIPAEQSTAYLVRRNECLDSRARRR